MKGAAEKDIRSFCAVFLRKQLSGFSEKSFDSQLKNLSPEVLSLIKLSLFQSLEQESESQVRHQVCDAIGEIGGSLFELDNKWPDLIPSIFQLFQSPNIWLQDGALRIIACNIEYQSSEYENYIPALVGVLDLSLKNEHSSLALSGHVLISALLATLAPKQIA